MNTKEAGWNTATFWVCLLVVTLQLGVRVVLFFAAKDREALGKGIAVLEAAQTELHKEQENSERQTSQATRKMDDEVF